jgi:hypothetical protein
MRGLSLMPKVSDIILKVPDLILRSIAKAMRLEG